MMTRKAQGALEFLTTYGWAFLVILIMIGALGYFGILNPTKFLPERCNVNSEFGCPEAQLVRNADGNKLQLSVVLINNLDQGLQLSENVRVISDIVVGGSQEAGSWVNASAGMTGLSAADGISCGIQSDSSVIQSGNTFTLMCEVDGTSLAATLPSTGNKLKISLQTSYVPQGRTLSKPLNVEVFGTLQQA